MVDEILKFTKITFLLHLIVLLIFTILFWMPPVFATLFALTFDAISSALCQMIAAIFTGATAMNLFGYLAKEWKQGKIYVIFEIVWLPLGIITVIINFAAYGISAILFLLVLIIFFVLFLITFLQQEEIIGIIIGK